MEDCDEVVLKYEEIKVLSTGNPLIKDKMELDRDVANLKLQKQSYLSNKYSLENKVKAILPKRIERYETSIEGLMDNIEIAKNHPKPDNAENFVGITVNGLNYQDKKEAGEFILKVCRKTFGTTPKPLGQYRGFNLEIQFNPVNGKHSIWINGKASKEVELGNDIYGNFTRLDNAIDNFGKQLDETKLLLDEALHQLEVANEELQKPFAKEDELSEKITRLAEIDAKLNLDEKEMGNSLEKGEYEEYGIKLNNRNEVVCLVDNEPVLWIDENGELFENIDFSFMDNPPTAKAMMQLLKDVSNHYQLNLDFMNYSHLVQLMDYSDFARLDGSYEYLASLNESKNEFEGNEQRLKEFIQSKFEQEREDVRSLHKSANLGLEI